MVMILIILMISSLSVVAFLQLQKIKKRKDEHRGGISKNHPLVLFLTICLLLCSVITEKDGRSMPFCLMFCLLAYQSVGKKEFFLIAINKILLCVFLLLWSIFARQSISSEQYLYGYIAVLILYVAFSIKEFYQRVRLVRNVMSMGNVWTSLTLQVDSLYMIILLLLSVIYLSFVIILPEETSVILSVLFSVFLYFHILAFAFRTMNTSVFIFWHKHERHIVESMRVANLEMVGGSLGEENLYETIYDRVLECFERQKLYLNPYLTINDVVESVYTNKYYVSRAISQHTGRNFCQFVNYYRVIYALELFRGNPNLKVVELASRSGFNTTASFTSAFRLFMGEKPSEWCRKERVLAMKKKKFVAQ